MSRFAGLFYIGYPKLIIETSVGIAFFFLFHLEVTDICGHQDSVKLGITTIHLPQLLENCDALARGRRRPRSLSGKPRILAIPGLNDTAIRVLTSVIREDQFHCVIGFMPIR